MRLVEDTHPSSEPYEAPQVESVLTADELAREIQYAGNQTLADVGAF